MKSIPELSDLPRRERNRLWRQYSPKALRHWQTWVSLAVCVVFISTAGLTGNAMMSYWPDLHPYIVIFIISLTHFGIGGLIVFQVTIAMTRPYIRREKK